MNKAPSFRLQWWCAFSSLILAGFVWSFLKSPTDRLADSAQLREAMNADNVAFQLVHGRGFVVDLLDSEWQAGRSITPDEANRIDSWAAVQTGKSTRISPLFPSVFAAVKFAFATPFWPMRILQVVFVAACLATLITTAGSICQSRWVVLFGVVFSAFDPWLFWNSDRFEVNQLSIGLLALLVALAALAIKTGRSWSWGSVGLVFGLEMLNRGASQIWLAWILLIWPVLGISWIVSRRPLVKYLAGTAFFFVAAVCVCMPWWIRNFQLTDGEAPWGRGIAINMTGGFGEDVIEQSGYFSIRRIRNAESTGAAPRFANLDLPQKEKEIERVAVAQTYGWIARNLNLLAELAKWKALNHLNLGGRPTEFVTILNWTLVLVGLAGCFACRNPISFWIAMVCLLSVATAATTWSAGGCDSIPLKPLFQTGVAMLLAKLIANRPKRKSAREISS